MSTRELVLQYLELHVNYAYSVSDLVGFLNASESRIRKHLNDLVDEGIIDQRGENPAYYGFNGKSCEYREMCCEYVSACDIYAHRCGRRMRYKNGGVNEFAPK
jgi:hypothetical protein